MSASGPKATTDKKESGAATTPKGVIVDCPNSLMFALVPLEAVTEDGFIGLDQKTRDAIKAKKLAAGKKYKKGTIELPDKTPASVIVPDEQLILSVYKDVQPEEKKATGKNNVANANPDEKSAPRKKRYLRGGSEGHTRVLQDINNRKLYAAKCKIHDDQNQHSVEYKVLTQLEMAHGKITRKKTKGLHEKKEQDILISDFFDGAPLDDLLHDHPEFFTEAILIDIAIEILSEIKKLHDQGILHCDIKLGNILYNPFTRKLKVIDYGNSRFGTRDTQQILRANEKKFLNPFGTEGYLSPELKNSQRESRMPQYNQQTEIYAAGKTLAYLFDLANVNADKKHPDYMSLCNRPPQKTGVRNVDVRKVIFELFQKMTATLPEQRATFEEAIAFFKSLQKQPDYTIPHKYQCVLLDVNLFKKRDAKEQVALAQAIQKALQPQKESDPVGQVWLVCKDSDYSQKDILTAIRRLHDQKICVGDKFICNVKDTTLSSSLLSGQIADVLNEEEGHYRSYVYLSEEACSDSDSAALKARDILPIRFQRVEDIVTEIHRDAKDIRSLLKFKIADILIQMNAEFADPKLVELNKQTQTREKLLLLLRNPQTSVDDALHIMDTFIEQFNRSELSSIYKRINQMLHQEIQRLFLKYKNPDYKFEFKQFEKSKKNLLVLTETEMVAQMNDAAAITRVRNLFSIVKNIEAGYKTGIETGIIDYHFYLEQLQRLKETFSTEVQTHDIVDGLIAELQVFSRPDNRAIQLIALFKAFRQEIQSFQKTAKTVDEKKATAAAAATSLETSFDLPSTLTGLLAEFKKREAKKKSQIQAQISRMLAAGLSREARSHTQKSSHPEKRQAHLNGKAPDSQQMRYLETAVQCDLSELTNEYRRIQSSTDFKTELFNCTLNVPHAAPITECTVPGMAAFHGSLTILKSLQANSYDPFDPRKVISGKAPIPENTLFWLALVNQQWATVSYFLQRRKFLPEQLDYTFAHFRKSLPAQVTAEQKSIFMQFVHAGANVLYRPSPEDAKLPSVIESTVILNDPACVVHVLQMMPFSPTAFMQVHKVASKKEGEHKGNEPVFLSYKKSFNDHVGIIIKKMIAHIEQLPKKIHTSSFGGYIESDESAPHLLPANDLKSELSTIAGILAAFDDYESLTPTLVAITKYINKLRKKPDIYLDKFCEFLGLVKKDIIDHEISEKHYPGLTLALQKLLQRKPVAVVKPSSNAGAADAKLGGAPNGLFAVKPNVLKNPVMIGIASALAPFKVKAALTDDDEKLNKIVIDLYHAITDDIDDCCQKIKHAYEQIQTIFSEDAARVNVMLEGFLQDLAVHLKPNVGASAAPC